MSPLALKRDHFTYGDYTRWPDDERWELIDGEAYNMCPAPTRIHQKLVLEIATQIHAFLRDSPCEVYVAPFDVRLPKADEADERVDTVVQPDIAVICDPGKLDDAGCRGAPNWIVEVLSPRTAAKDQRQKRDAYERAGVREYWLVHPTDRTLMIYRLADGAYGRPEVQALVGETAVAAMAGLCITWPAAPAETAAAG
ncbi:Uma2 family endonuclease [uncultured Thiodictyon sp.]|uniref:Uma2 family endonuclease n=1 Tax=uncultured Thiodictyon sp. TaxID=1846217 RepID=UPI0025F28E18|nr:Uma2 family endonuclease [uncultured Thiodictyon sp.]